MPGTAHLHGGRMATLAPNYGRTHRHRGVRIVIELFLAFVNFDHFEATLYIGRGFHKQTHLVG